MLVSSLRDDAFQHFAFVIDGAPEIVALAVDLHEHLVHVRLPFRVGTELLNPFSFDLLGEHWAEPIPPIPYRLVADVDAAFMENIFDVPQRKRETHVEHHRQADDFRPGFKVFERVAFWHAGRVGGG